MRYAAKMVARAVIVIALPLLASHQAMAQPGSPAITVRAVEVEGNSRVDRSTILFYVKLKEGNSYLNTELVEQVRADVRTIYELGFFRDVRSRVEPLEGGLRVVFVVKEKPTITRIEIVGNSNVDIEKIRERITVKAQTIVNETVLKEAVRNVRQLYQESGYYFARVEAVLKQSGPNAVGVTFVIDEGEDVRIESITFQGNDNVSRRDLLKAMDTGETGFFSFLTNSGVFNEEELQRDLVRLRLLYENRGYIKVQVQQPIIREDRERGRVDITIPITEGLRYEISKIEIVGGEDVVPAEELKDRMRLFEGDVFNRTLLLADTKDITLRFSNRGYAFADVRPFTKTNDEKKTVEILVRINKGQRVYIGKVDVRGNTRTRENVIRREVRVVEGSLYSKEGLDLTRYRLARRGYFETVKIDEKRRPGSDEVLDIDIEVTEKPTGSVTGGVGVNSDEGFYLQGEIRESNLFGRGLIASLFSRISSDRFDLIADYLDPSFRDSGFSLGGRLFFGEEEFDSFNNETKGGRITVGKELGEFLNAYLSYELSDSYISNVSETAASTIQEQANETFIESQIIPRLVYDSQNSRIFPTAGTHWSITPSISGGFLGGNVDVFSFEADFRHHRSIGDFFRVRALRQLVATMRANVRYIDALKGDLPAFRRLYAGRRHAVRGFRSSDLGPKDAQGESIGGFSAALASVQIWHPFIGPTHIAAFVDMGNVWEKDEMFDEFRYGAGVGLGILTPIGPMRLDIGYKLDRKTGERNREAHLGIGTAF